jgi:hypothetical protein
MNWPVIGRFLLWRHSTTFMRVCTLLVGAVMVVHGLTGPRLAPKNLATVLTWLRFRGLLVLGLLLLVSIWLMAQPMEMRGTFLA